jgi:hypothetical protein
MHSDVKVNPPIFKPTRHHVADTGNRASSSIWRAINGCRTPPSAIRFLFRIEMQHYSCNLAPVSTFRIPVEKAQIRDDVLLRAPRSRESIRNQRARYRRHRDQAAVSAYAFSRQVVVDQFCARQGISVGTFSHPMVSNTSSSPAVRPSNS